MAKGALYWRLKDEKTGKWSYKRATYIKEKTMGRNYHYVVDQIEEEE
jgi:hypothetical protein